MIRIRTLLILLFLAIASSPVHAKNFKILTGEWAPYVSETMEEGGPTAQIVSAALTAVGHTASFEYVPWKRTEAMTQKGKYVATFPWSATDDFKKTCFLSTPLAFQNMVFFYMKDKHSGWDYTDLEDLKQYKIGGSQGYSYVQIFEEAGIKASYAPTVENSFKKLIYGRIDFLPESQLVGWKTVKDGFAADAEKIASSKTPLFSKPLYLMISQTHEDGKELHTAFEKGFSIIQENGIYKQIVEKFGLPE